MPERLRLLLIGPPPGSLEGVLPAADLEHVAEDPAAVAQKLHDGNFAAVVATSDVVAGLLARFHRDELILSHIEKGLAVLDPDGIVTWANGVFRDCCAADPIGRVFLTALGARLAAIEISSLPAGAAPPVESPGVAQRLDPLAPTRCGRPALLRLHCPGNTRQPYLEADVRPVVEPGGEIVRLIVLLRNVTAEVIQQQKLDALHQAGQEMAGLDSEQLAEMDVQARIELLKHNLRRFIHDLLRYDVIEVRLLNRKTGQLTLLLEEGMLPEAAQRVLFARPTGNGLTGLVAYTGASYLCEDAASDPHYLSGSPGARSSMTVPLKFHDEVIGTLNVESPRVNGFGPDDLQFTELFSKEIAAALHTLDLLSAQQVCTVSQSIEAVSKEIALPIDEILARASLLVEQNCCTDPEATARLHAILEAARRIKDSVRAVGKSLATGPLNAPPDQPLQGRRVLVVDSDEQMRRQAHLLLTRLGAVAEAAAKGEEGIAMAAVTDYDAIFQEVKPPDMGGYDCYLRLRRERPNAVIAMTTGFGYDTAHSVVKARTDGLKHVLFKPFRQDQVVRAVLERTAAPSARG